MDIEEEFTASNDHTQIIVKRKRTKRRRTGLIVTSSSSSGCDIGCAGGADFSIQSRTNFSSSDISANSEEDEDMANCLMLLSQSSSPIQNDAENKAEKLNNRKSTASSGGGAAMVTAGKGGSYIYECKTCNRTFPSFQALGGHRASHKKPKVAPPVIMEEKKSPVVKPECEEEVVNYQFDKIMDFVQPISVQRDNNRVVNDTNNHKASKVHECSICGSEFSSGQALGGHMRRHRTPAVVAPEPEKTRRFLSLDLNLPAPEEDCLGEFAFTPNQQQHSIVFSAPALVDCHY
ncbi:hypothetical protein LguiA_012329 [Lonicera macranthoides]